MINTFHVWTTAFHSNDHHCSCMNSYDQWSLPSMFIVHSFYLWSMIITINVHSFGYDHWSWTIIVHRHHVWKLGSWGYEQCSWGSKAMNSVHLTPEQQKVLQRSSAAASWARALWAERGCCKQIRRAIGSLREQERARGSQREQESKPERARERLALHLKHASTLFCCKTVKYNSVLS